MGLVGNYGKTLMINAEDILGSSVRWHDSNRDFLLGPGDEVTTDNATIAPDEFAEALGLNPAARLTAKTVKQQYETFDQIRKNFSTTTDWTIEWYGTPNAAVRNPNSASFAIREHCRKLGQSQYHVCSEVSPRICADNSDIGTVVRRYFGDAELLLRAEQFMADANKTLDAVLAAPTKDAQATAALPERTAQHERLNWQIETAALLYSFSTDAPASSTTDLQVLRQKFREYNIVVTELAEEVAHDYSPIEPALKRIKNIIQNDGSATDDSGVTSQWFSEKTKTLSSPDRPTFSQLRFHGFNYWGEREKSNRVSGEFRGDAEEKFTHAYRVVKKVHGLLTDPVNAYASSWAQFQKKWPTLSMQPRVDAIHEELDYEIRCHVVSNFLRQDIFTESWDISCDTTSTDDCPWPWQDTEFSKPAFVEMPTKVVNVTSMEHALILEEARYKSGPTAR